MQAVAPDMSASVTFGADTQTSAVVNQKSNSKPNTFLVNLKAKTKLSGESQQPENEVTSSDADSKTAADINQPLTGIFLLLNNLLPQANNQEITVTTEDNAAPEVTQVTDQPAAITDVMPVLSQAVPTELVGQKAEELNETSVPVPEVTDMMASVVARQDEANFTSNSITTSVPEDTVKVALVDPVSITDDIPVKSSEKANSAEVSIQINNATPEIVENDLVTKSVKQPVTQPVSQQQKVSDIANTSADKSNNLQISAEEVVIKNEVSVNPEAEPILVGADKPPISKIASKGNEQIPTNTEEPDTVSDFKAETKTVISKPVKPFEPVKPVDVQVAVSAEQSNDATKPVETSQADDSSEIVWDGDLASTENKTEAKSDNNTDNSLLFRLHQASQTRIVKANIEAMPQENVKHVLQKLELMVRDNQSQAQMVLKPEHLGQLIIKMDMQDGVLTAKFVVENLHAKSMLESNISMFRQQLEQSGVRVEKVEVTLNQPGNDSSQFLNQQQYRQPGQGNYQNQGYSWQGPRNNNGLDGYSYQADETPIVAAAKSYTLGAEGVNYVV